jgi:hypothetical protein
MNETVRWEWNPRDGFLMFCIFRMLQKPGGIVNCLKPLRLYPTNYEWRLDTF